MRADRTALQGFDRCGLGRGRLDRAADITAARKRSEPLLRLGSSDVITHLHPSDESCSATGTEQGCQGTHYLAEAAELSRCGSIHGKHKIHCDH